MLVSKSIQARLIPSVRCFSVQRSLQGAVKERLSKFVNDGRIMETQKKTNKYKEAFKRREKRKNRPDVDKRSHASLRKQKAVHYIKQNLGQDIDLDSIGPETNDDLKFVSKVDKKTLLVILGTTEEQLLDSVFVSNTAKAFLRRGQTEKAMLVCKLAREQGIVGMNFVVDHLIKTGSIDEAINLHNWRKKWGVPPNEQGLTTLFDSLSKVRGENGTPGLTNIQTKKLKTIFEKIPNSSGFRTNATHVNACLNALINCRDQSVAFDFYEQIKEDPLFKHFKPNTITYTILFQGLSRSPNDIWSSVRAEDLMLEVKQKFPESKLDSMLLYAYSRALTSCGRHYIKLRGIKVAQACFDIPQTTPEIYWTLKFDEANRGSGKLQFDPIVPLKTKLDPNVFLADDLIKTCLEIGNERLGVELYENFASRFPNKVDIHLTHKYMISLKKGNRKTSGENLVLFYQKLLTDQKFFHIETNDETTFKVLDGIHSQIHSTLHRENFETKNVERCAPFFHLLESFMTLAKDKIGVRGYAGYLKCTHRLVLTPEAKKVVRSRIQHIRNYMETVDTKKMGKAGRDLKIELAKSKNLFYSSTYKSESTQESDIKDKTDKHKKPRHEMKKSHI
ncbi:hypothetical protein BN7_3826 [Wickerhamomyces ciferrii]|uniref:Uncharacterized protein n=1 Tax=Wickerhamomyces ciferrii (strain ATCC 14091 / BCRC 22168 / CBS 111 / JCM 3599 / NBRC 0793 / NRRL Y-1031 F-60-10) TaxID=1206466 RepID=K0KGJ8_WICCF|nr:uncharacterized protein BN7_3826 [Wickerhamomyces ciferrii]CCH44265.1 hypothetical protein BN7_3826 [Wickerhamomyces ciferrii]